MKNALCKITLLHFRKVVGATQNECVDKGKRSFSGFHAPNGKYYDAHCRHCAELEYLEDVYDK